MSVPKNPRTLDEWLSKPTRAAPVTLSSATISSAYAPVRPLSTGEAAPATITSNTPQTGDRRMLSKTVSTAHNQLATDAPSYTVMVDPRYDRPPPSATPSAAQPYPMSPIPPTWSHFFTSPSNAERVSPAETPATIARFAAKVQYATTEKNTSARSATISTTEATSTPPPRQLLRGYDYSSPIPNPFARGSSSAGSLSRQPLSTLHYSPVHGCNTLPIVSTSPISFDNTAPSPHRSEPSTPPSSSNSRPNAHDALASRNTSPHNVPHLSEDRKRRTAVASTAPNINVTNVGASMPYAKLTGETSANIQPQRSRDELPPSMDVATSCEMALTGRRDLDTSFRRAIHSTPATVLRNITTTAPNSPQQSLLSVKLTDGPAMIASVSRPYPSVSVPNVTVASSGPHALPPNDNGAHLDGDGYATFFLPTHQHALRPST